MKVRNFTPPQVSVSGEELAPLYRPPVLIPSLHLPELFSGDFCARGFTVEGQAVQWSFIVHTQ